MTKVLIDAHMIGSSEGGNARYVEGIGKSKEAAKSVKIIFYRQKTHSILKDIERLSWGLEAYAAKVKADVIHSTYFGPLFSSRKVVLTVHDFLFCKYPDLLTFKEFLLFKLLFPISIRKASAIIVPSEFSKKEGIKYYPFIKDKIFVTHEATSFKHNKKRKIGNFFLTFGTSKRKNIDTIIKAFISLKRKDLKLYIIGKHSKTSPRENIFFLGKIPDKRLIDMYAGAIATPYNSFYEGFDLPILESASFGVPLILSDIPTHREVAGSNALYVNPRSKKDLCKKMKMMLEKTTNEKYSKLSKELSKKYSWENTVKETVKIYKWVKEK